MSDADELGFYAGLPTLDRFDRLADPASYAAVPEDWVLGLADIVQSTAAIAAGRYKEVNTAAAAVIAAVSNALPERQIPFVFGGDGASFALAGADAAVGREALARTAAWISANFGLTMRVALVPVSESAGTATTCASPASPPRPTSPMPCSPAAGWPLPRRG